MLPKIVCFRLGHDVEDFGAGPHDNSVFLQLHRQIIDHFLAQYADRAADRHDYPVSGPGDIDHDLPDDLPGSVIDHEGITAGAVYGLAIWGADPRVTPRGVPAR